ncbi:hypothetical protein BLNAU_23327 [Blattamonas nauphoetae]|uniref:Uncharacterized protein n=1 Tax=Blattamonas nauphoetae TaxID=2049346 RepID=A0ABQ9WQK4_9EUKA|nr:hypothetical protein BLNAU_23327 [Blattamonas nauphoetae]
MTNSKRSSVNQNERSPNLNRKDESAVQREDVSIRITVTQRKKELMRIALNRRVEELSQTIEQIKADNIIVTFDPTCFIMKSATVTRINTQEHAGCFTKPVLKGIHRMSLKIEDVIVLMGVIDATKYHNHLTTFVYTSPNAAMMNRNNGYLYTAGRIIAQNAVPRRGQEWSAEADLEKRTLHFFVDRVQQPHHFVNIPVPLVFALDVRTKKVPIPIAFWGELEQTIGERRRNARVGHVVSEHRAEQRGAGRVECGWDRSAVSVQHPFTLITCVPRFFSTVRVDGAPITPLSFHSHTPVETRLIHQIGMPFAKNIQTIYILRRSAGISFTDICPWELSREMISIVRSVISAESTVDPTWLTMPQHLHHFIVAMEEFSEHCPSIPWGRFDEGRHCGRSLLLFPYPIHINRLSLLLHPPSTFASDLRLLTSYFDDFLESLQSCDRLLPPPEFRNKDIWTIISLTCVRHLAQRGLLSCEGLTQQDLLQLIQNQLLSHLHSSSVPFDADQRFFTSVNERPPSPPNSALSFFGSESGNEMRTVSNSESTGTGTSQWTNTTQLSSKERLFVVETIHTILSKQPNSDRTPSTLASRPSPNPPLQPLSHSLSSSHLPSSTSTTHLSPPALASLPNLLSRIRPRTILS